MVLSPAGRDDTDDLAIFAVLSKKENPDQFILSQGTTSVVPYGH
jgi:hypothetical protein